MGYITDMEDISELVIRTKKSALYVWMGLLLAMTLFYVQSQIVFIHGSPRRAPTMTVALGILGVLTFLLASAFFDRYSLSKKEDWKRLKLEDRRPEILMGFVFQWILFETLGLYGVLLSVFTQDKVWAVPFIALAYIGFWRSFPKESKITPIMEMGI